MNTVGGVNGSSGIYSADASGAAGLSPDMLLAYCQTQLGGLDDEIKSDIKQQNLELQEREAAEKATSAVQQYGDNGPTDANAMQNCVDQINKAIQSLPAGDPVAAELQGKLQNMETKYHFQAAVPGQPLNVDQQGAMDAALGTMNASSGPDDPSYQDAANTQATLQAIVDGTPAKYTSGNGPQNDDWKGTTNDFSSVVDDIKSNAEIQMLQLQDLVSQRQQAVSMATGMMSKEDQSLEQLARLGQG